MKEETGIHGPDFDFLSTLPVFADLPEEILASIISRLKRKMHKEGEFIFRQGEPVNRLYILEHGKVEIFKKDIKGKRLTLWFLETGGVFCLASIFAQSAFANALVLKDSLVLSISKQELMSILGTQAGLVNRFIGCLSQKIVAYSTIVQDITFKSVPERLASFLLRCIHLDCNSDMICSVSQNEIASLLGTRREVVSRALKRLSKKGIIELIPAGKNRHIKILDEDGLRRAVHGEI